MRITTWNCYRGECRTRAARLESLRPDICLLQECGRPQQLDDQCQWMGSNPRQGVAVITNGEWNVRPGPVDSAVPDSVYPYVISGPSTFHILAVWSKPRPTYVQAIHEGLDSYRDFARSAPTIVAGDFNSHACFDKGNPRWFHSTIVDRLREEFGLVSTFHSHSSESPDRPEPATIYWRWQETQPFHIDYCFIPQTWASYITAVEIGNYADWKDSDHRPLSVEIADSAIQTPYVVRDETGP